VSSNQIREREIESREKGNRELFVTEEEPEVAADAALESPLDLASLHSIWGEETSSMEWKNHSPSSA
jgi:hypothetical protein